MLTPCADNPADNPLNNTATNIANNSRNKSGHHSVDPSAEKALTADMIEQLIATSDFADLTDPSKLAQPTPPPIAAATYKACAEDFVVNEQMEIDFTGEGEHLWLHVKKTGMNTAYVATLLAQWAQIPTRDVGYSGLKDRHAVTSQWFSLRLPSRTLPQAPFSVELKPEEEIEIMAQHWHHKKLGRGAHKRNQFIISLTDLSYEDKAQVEKHLAHIQAEGVPNYFGVQRFGHNGDNIKQALRHFMNARAFKTTIATSTPPHHSPALSSNTLSLRQSSNSSQSSNKRKRRKGHQAREQQSLLLSSSRSLIFNKIVAARVKDGSWRTGLDGEVFNLDGTGSVFAAAQLDEELIRRLQAKDIHPTAPLWGSKDNHVSGAAKQLECDVVAADLLLSALASGLQAGDIRAHRRATRLMIADMTWTWRHPQRLELSFSLPTGSYATALLYAVVQQLGET